MAVTISTEVNVYRSTDVAARAKIASWTEPSVGAIEATYTLRVAPNTAVTIPMAGITAGTWLFIDGKPNGGTTDVNLLLQLTNTAASGVAAGVQDVRFGSKIIIMDSNFTAAIIKNLDLLNAVDVQIKIMGN